MKETVARRGTKYLLKLVNSIYLVKIFIGEYYNIFKKKGLYENVTLTKEQVKEIQLFWKIHYGKKVSTRWHRLYQSYNGRFNKRYFPEILFTMRLERKLNNREIGKVLSDKSLFPMYYREVKGVRLPDTYIMNNSGIYYTAERKIITEENALSILEDIGECVIKPTLDSSSGDSVILCDFRMGIDQKSNREVREVITSYDENFLVQERIIPSKKLQTLYPDSINTLRVITYLIGDKVMHAPVTLSMGRKGNHVDNIQAGGLSVGMSDEGELYHEAYTHFREVHEHHPDTGTVFKDVKLPKIKEVIEVAKVMHEKTPHTRMVSWDITLDEEDNIVLLEFNIFGQSVWFPQMVSGKAVFGEDTEQMINMMQK